MGTLLFLVSLFWGKANAVSLDTHVHFQTYGSLYPNTYNMRAITMDDSMEHFQSVLAQNDLNRFFLISEAYLATDVDQALEKNHYVAELAANHPRSVPVCGVSVAQDFYTQVMKDCLEMGFKGFKFHLSNEQSLLDGAALKNMAFALAQIPENQQAFALIHFYFTGYNVAADKAQTQSLITLSQALPNVRFIIAHAATSNPKMLLDIADFYEQHPDATKNIYTETSTLFTSFNSDLVNYYGFSLENYREIFMKFGIERVLYGSDTFVSNPVNRKEINFILQKGLSLYEQDRLLEKNGEKFLLDLGL